MAGKKQVDNGNSAATFQVTESPDGFDRSGKRASGPNPLLEHVRSSYENGGKALEVPCDGDEQRKAIRNYVRRAASELGIGARIQDKVDENGTGKVKFAGKERSARKYTADEIRAWARENGYDPADGKKIPAETRNAFKVANGYVDSEKASLV